MNFVGFWNRCFRCSERLVCYIKRQKSFFTISFHALWPGNTGCYKGLQVITRGYKGWQGVTTGYKGLQRVTGGYRRLQRIIETLFWVERSQILFLKLFCQKNQIWRNLKFLTETMDYSLWKNSNFAFFINSCFYSL